MITRRLPLTVTTLRTLVEATSSPLVAATLALALRLATVLPLDLAFLLAAGFFVGRGSVGHGSDRDGSERDGHQRNEAETSKK